MSLFVSYIIFKFESVSALRLKLHDDFGEHVPSTTNFNVGYFEGQQHLKVWLVTADDLNSMYLKCSRGGDIVLWCDGKSDSDSSTTLKRKRSNSDSGSTRHDKEDEVESIYKDLKEKHNDKYDTPKLRLWARMIASDLHDNYETPPNVPAFSGSTPKRYQTENMYAAITGAAVAFANALGGQKPSISSHPSPLSPGKSIELRMKNFEQLRYLQQLFDDGILNDKEYAEQKANIISSLHKLS